MAFLDPSAPTQHRAIAWSVVGLGFAITIGLFVAACLTPTLHDQLGWSLLVFGPLGMLFCVEPVGFGLIWLANVGVMVGGVTRSFPGVAAAVLSVSTQALSWMFACVILFAPGRMSIMVNEGGTMRVVESLGIGVYLWLASLFAFAVSCQLAGWLRDRLRPAAAGAAPSSR